MTPPAPVTYTGWMIRGLLLLASCLVLAACGSDGEATATKPAQTGPPKVAASCILAAEYDGHRYIGTAVKSPPREGPALGQAKVPACNDTPGALEDSSDQLVDVAELEGVPPEVAIVWQGRDDVVLIREDVNQQKLPPALTKLIPPG